MPIVVYTRRSCAPCATLKYWLSRKGVKFQEISFEENPEAYPPGYRIFPLIQIGDEYIQGLNLTRVASLLHLS